MIQRLERAIVGVVKYLALVAAIGASIAAASCFLSFALNRSAKPPLPSSKYDVLSTSNVDVLADQLSISRYLQITLNPELTTDYRWSCSGGGASPSVDENRVRILKAELKDVSETAVARLPGSLRPDSIKSISAEALIDRLAREAGSAPSCVTPGLDRQALDRMFGSSSLRSSYASFFEVEYERLIGELLDGANRRYSDALSAYEAAKVETAESYPAAIYWLGLLLQSLLIFLLALGVQRLERRAEA